MKRFSSAMAQHEKGRKNFANNKKYSHCLCRKHNTVQRTYKVTIMIKAEGSVKTKMARIHVKTQKPV